MCHNGEVGPAHPLINPEWGKKARLDKHMTRIVLFHSEPTLFQTREDTQLIPTLGLQGFLLFPAAFTTTLLDRPGSAEPKLLGWKSAILHGLSIWHQPYGESDRCSIWLSTFDAKEQVLRASGRHLSQLLPGEARD